MTDATDISIVVCTFNRASTLERALRSLLALERCNAFACEIVAVDDGSTDDTADVLARLASDAAMPLQIVHGAGEGIAAARNAGIAAARGRFIAFFDDDQLADPDWLLVLWRLQQGRGADCVGGPRSLMLESGAPESLPTITRLLLGEIPATGDSRRYGRNDILCTGNMMLKRGVFETVGAFNPALREGGEDTDLFRRMREARLSCWYTPAAMVHHLIPPYRLESDYLRWTAIRGGRCYARRDLDELGALQTLFLAALRLVHATGIHGAQLLRAKVRGDLQESLARQCMLARAAAYTGAAVRGIFAGKPAQAPSSATDFRSERALFTASKQSEG